MIVRTGASWEELESASRFKPAIVRRHAAAACGLRCCENDFGFRINVGKEVETRAGRHGNVGEDDIGTFCDGPQFVFCLSLFCRPAHYLLSDTIFAARQALSTAQSQ